MQRWMVATCAGIVLAGATGGLPGGGAVLAAEADAAVSAPALAAADYQRSLGLREAWMGLTRNLADPAAWRDDRRFHYRRTTEGGFEFVAADVDDRTPRRAFDHERLAEGLGRATGATYAPLRLPFETFSFSQDGASITVQAEGKTWVCGLTDYVCAVRARPAGQRRAFGVVRDLSMAADNTPHVSPDARYEAFVQGHNLAIRTKADGSVRVLSRDGSAGDFYDPQSIVWSPDSRVVAAYRVRPGYARVVTRVETSPADQVEPKLQAQLYPKPGDPVDIDRPVLFHVEDGRQVTVDDALFPNPYAMSALTFRPDGRTLSLKYTERGHQRVRLIEISAQTGAARAVVDETAETFINNWSGSSSYREIGDGAQEVVWTSERDGWKHLYLIDSRTGRARPITRGEFVVRNIVHVDEKTRRIWFSASGMDPKADPYLQHYYRIDFDGRNLTALTSADAYHDVAFSPDMRWYVDTYSRVDLPTVSELRNAETGERVAVLEQADISRLTAAGFKAPEVFSAPGRDGQTPIWGLIVRPTDYDPSRTYPVIENIYAGPHDSFVPKTFWPFGYHSGGDKVIGMQSLADLGFIVVQIDGMGTLNRSKAFHDVAWRNLGDSGFPDRIAWHKALAARDPSYDLSKGVGIYGASAGGQSALGALLFQSDFYSVAVAYNGCYDNRMDKISWNEQWMGWPVGDHYAASSGVDNAWRLKGRLLMIVGEQDENVDPASTYQVADALIRAGKDFDLLALPGEGHTVGRSDGPIDYVQRRQFDFFVRHLKGGATPDWNRSPAQ